MAYDNKGSTPSQHERCDNGGIVRETAALADRAKQFSIASISMADPVSGEAVGFPLAAIGGVQVDLSAEFDKWRKRPQRLSGVAYVETLDSFIDLVNRHKDAGSAIFAYLRGDQPWLRAVIDYHEIDHNPRFGRHSILYKFPLAPEFVAWKTNSGKPLDQNKFAEWIEDHIHELVSPSEDEAKEFEGALGLKFGHPHELVKVARGISIHANLKVANVQTLATGETQVAYEETHTVRDSDSKPIKVPSLVMVSVPMFYGGEEVRLPFRLRYERVGGAVVWKLLAFRLDRLMLTALQAEYEDALSATALPGFRGAPEMP